jgi:hypothetical protein
MRYTASVVLTTIHSPVILEEYFVNAAKHGHLDRVTTFVIPDRKTPAGIFDAAAGLTKRGFRVVCPNLDEQEHYLDHVGFSRELVPHNSDNRRNVGYLMAYESGSDFIVSIDDDNYCLPDSDFFADHSVVCERETAGTIVNTDTGWYNICDLLQLDRPGRTYARGFPFRMRHQSEKVTAVAGAAEVAINAGLWLKDPDVDAISWLVNPAHSLDMRSGSVILGPKAWTPVNSQNTALRRDVLPSYYFVRMGYPLSGIPIDRYGDIFSGYFAEACVRHLGQAVRVGTPLADHRRNSHNYMTDAANEWACIMVLEDLLPWLTEVRLEGRTCAEAYISLSHAIEDVVEKLSGRIWTDATRGYFHHMAYCMRRWVNACNVLNREALAVA